MSSNSKWSPVLRMALETILRRNSSNVQQLLRQQSSSPQRPGINDRDGWRDYWQKMGQPWRTEPEIHAKRQRYLAERRAIVPDVERGIYPFKDVKLTRADVEWLLATHENGHGPVDWSDECQQESEGLDLRGADLRKVNLSDLPLTGLIGGLTGSIWFYASPEECEMAAVRMQDALLIRTQLAGAKLNQSYLDRANLYRSNLEKAELRAASLKAAYLNETFLGGTLFRRAHLEGALLTRAHLEGVTTPPADLRGAFFDNATVLTGITLGNAVHGYVQLADVSWGSTNLSRIDWSPITMLGDEYEARQSKKKGEDKDRQITLYETAVRANRQLAVALQAQGMNEQAARFAYRANILQKTFLWLQMLQPKIKLTQRLRLLGSWLFSWFLFLLAGYGYRPGRSIIAYLLMICLFGTAYFLFGLAGEYHLQWYEALVVSLTAFHGRGFFSQQFNPGDPQAIIAAIEAVVGLVIEISFIATFTQRFFGK